MIKQLNLIESVNHWTDMPEFNQPDTRSMRHVIVHFDTEEDAKEFYKNSNLDMMFINGCMV